MKGLADDQSLAYHQAVFINNTFCKFGVLLCVSRFPLTVNTLFAHITFQKNILIEVIFGFIFRQRKTVALDAVFTTNDNGIGKASVI